MYEGDFLDWWRVEKIKSPKHLRLFAEMKLPGRAWLDFELKPLDRSSCDLYLTAMFDPSGFFGLVYWYSLYPIHFFIFDGLLKGLKHDIESSKQTS